MIAAMKHEVLWKIQGVAGIDEPVMFGRPELKYALETILENADGFADDFVIFGIWWDDHVLEISISDDGQGFKQSILKIDLDSPLTAHVKDVMVTEV